MLAAAIAKVAVSLLLSVTAASVIGWYEETLAAVISLAVFLPVISGVGGNAGNQSMAFSIRELSLGLIEPHEFSWVIVKEARVALCNGLLMGSILGLVAIGWQNNWMLGLVLAIALLSSTVLASILGGIIPMALKHLGWDPAWRPVRSSSLQWTYAASYSHSLWPISFCCKSLADAVTRLPIVNHLT